MVQQLKSSAIPLAKDRRWQILPKPWRFLIVTVLVIGIFFRFANLDNKPYWWDEVTNSIHSAGYSKQDFRNQIEAWKDKDITIEDLHKYQYPSSETSSLDVIRALANNLSDKVRIRFVGKPDINEISKVFSDQFLLNYPQAWLNSIEKENKFKIEKIYQGNVVKNPGSKLNFSLVRIL